MGQPVGKDSLHAGPDSHRAFSALRSEETEESYLTPEPQGIVELISKAHDPWRLQDIAAALGKKKSNVANLLADLIKQGIVVKVGYGKYQLKGGSGKSCDAEGTSKGGKESA